ncbi:MAG: hypothetical protein ACRCXT_05615 [Paraclostridium sp.]
MNELSKLNKQLQSKVLFRGTLEGIAKELSDLTGTKTELVPFEEYLPENDLGYNIFLGMIGGHYLDYEVYLLPTNKVNVYIITEINSF